MREPGRRIVLMTKNMTAPIARHSISPMPGGVTIPVLVDLRAEPKSALVDAARAKGSRSSPAMRSPKKSCMAAQA